MRYERKGERTMTKGQVLKTLVKSSERESGFLVQVKDLELPIEYAIAVWEMLSEPIQPEKKPEKPVKKEAPKAGKKKPLDEGKLLALRKAGWSFEKIADELGCATQTIINRYKELTKEEKK